MSTIHNAVSDFFNRYPYAAEMGRLTTASELDSLSKPLQKVLPKWYQDLLLEFPLVGLEVGIPNHFGQEELQAKNFHDLPLFPIRILSANELATHSLEMHPGILLFKRYLPFTEKYLPFAIDESSTGDPIFISTSHSNPAPKLVMHDMGNTARQLLKHAETLTSSFSDFFLYARLVNSRIRLNDSNRIEAIKRIRDFFTFADADIAATPPGKFNISAIANYIRRRDEAWTAEDYLRSLNIMEQGLYDSNFPVTDQYMIKLRGLYELCGLHLPELCFLEDRLADHTR